MNNGLRVPVVSIEGKPLMPTKPSKARYLVKNNLASPCRDKMGQFYIKLMFKTKTENTQTMVLADDPGSMFTGIAVVGLKTVNVGLNLYLPTYLDPKKDKQGNVIGGMLIERGQLRRMRKRRRRLGHHKATIKGGISKVRKAPKHKQLWWKYGKSTGTKAVKPCIKIRKDMELAVIKNLVKLYPISNFAYEHTKLNHYKDHRKARSFSLIEVGVDWFLSELEKIAPVEKFYGLETKPRRLQLGLAKNGEKSSNDPSAHVTDAISLANLAFEKLEITHDNFLTNFWYSSIRRPERASRRYKLHKQTIYPGGVKVDHGGSKTKLLDKYGTRVQYGDIVRFDNGSEGYNSGQYFRDYAGDVIARIQTTYGDKKVKSMRIIRRFVRLIPDAARFNYASISKLFF